MMGANARVYGWPSVFCVVSGLQVLLRGSRKLSVVAGSQQASDVQSVGWIAMAPGQEGTYWYIRYR